MWRADVTRNKIILEIIYIYIIITKINICSFCADYKKLKYKPISKILNTNKINTNQAVELVFLYLILNC